MSEQATTPQLFELASNRRFNITVHRPAKEAGAEPEKRVYGFTCRRPELKDWLAYWNKFFIASRRTEDGGTESIQDIDSAHLGLAGDLLIEATGYKVADDKQLCEIEGWQGKLPAEHRLVIASLLAGARTVSDASDELDIHIDGESVRLRAVWGADDAGSTLEYRNLIHRFKSPTDGQYQRYNRAANRSVILGGSRQGTTQFVGGQAETVKLYDELVTGVEGYSFNGQPLTSVEQIRAVMDAHHKYIAVMQILQPNIALTDALLAAQKTEAVQ